MAVLGRDANALQPERLEHDSPEQRPGNSMNVKSLALQGRNKVRQRLVSPLQGFGQ
jgi:hypothetical protein